MCLSQRVGRRSVRTTERARKAVAACVMDTLEARCLFAGETFSAISPVLASISTPSSNSITLNQYFSDSAIPGTVVTFDTSLGKIKVALTDAATPLTVANFLSYVTSGAYNNTIFHRSVVLTTGDDASPTNPGDIIQGGGYVLNGKTLSHIATNAPVADEYTKEVLNDSSGTLAMAKTASADSATSEWYFNVHDDVSALDPPTTDSNGVTTSYTVFGKVLSGENVVNEIAALPTYNVSGASTTVSVTNAPVVGLSEGQAKKGLPITANNLVYTRSITSTPGTTYTVSSDNTELVTPTVSDGLLSFKYAAGISGTATITIVATNIDGTSATGTVSVTVPDSATASAGPTAGAVTAPSTVEGSSSTFSVLGTSTDSVAALDPTTVAIVNQPTNGTASVNASTGLVTYTPTAGYTGSDTLTYTVGDTAGTTSAAGTVTLDVVAAPTTVTIGTRLTKSLTFTQPSGAIGHLSISGGVAVVTFASGAVTTTTKNGVVTASGAGATIASMVVTDTASSASLTLTGTGALTLGSVTDAGKLSQLYAPNATLTGTSSFGSIGRLVAGAATGATLSLGSGDSTALTIPVVTNSTVLSNGSIGAISSKQWLSTDDGYHEIFAASVARLNVTGTFGEILNLTASGTSLGSAAVGNASGAWTLAGAAGSVAMGTPASTWSITATGPVASLKVVGNLASNVSAGSIGTMNVTGTTTGATIETTANYSSKQLEIGSMRFGGAVSSSVISSVGNVGTITAASLAGTHIFAGLQSASVTAGTLAASDSDILVNAKIGTVVLGRATTAFSNSLISAYQLGALRLGNVATSNGGTTEGVSAEKIGAVTARLVPGGVVNAGPAQLKTVQTLSAYENKKKITPGDFVITIITT